MPRATPTAKPSDTKGVSTSSSRLQTAAPSLGKQPEQTQRQQQQKKQEISLTDRSRAPPSAQSNTTAPPRGVQGTAGSAPSKGSKEKTVEDPSDPVVVNYQGPDRFYSFAEKEKIWDYVMKNAHDPAATRLGKKPQVKQPEVKK